jgi:hypothetical protein
MGNCNYYDLRFILSQLFEDPSLFREILSASFKFPSEYNFDLKPYRFSQSILKFVHNSFILAPSEVSVVIGLLDPSVKSETPHVLYTQHIFRNAGRDHEALTRTVALEYISSCDGIPGGQAALLESVGFGVDSVVAKECPDGNRFFPVVNACHSCGTWKEIAQQDGYILYQRQ